MTENKWPDALLDKMRGVGDPLADQVVATMAKGEDLDTIRNRIANLVQNDQPVPSNLPVAVRKYFETPVEIPRENLEGIEAGQHLFERCGPEILMVLACYSLPASYAARKGVEVLYRTAYLKRRATRRVFETGQMIIDVLAVGGLTAEGRGIRTAQKVRLWHALIRRDLQIDPEKPWNEKELGVPINQEDLAGTFLVFTHLVIDGLQKLGIQTTEDERRGYLEVWKIVARILGIQECLIPATMGEAENLFDRIRDRQLQVCPEGIAMNDALLEMLEKQLPPGLWRNWPSVLMRFFLPSRVADHFGIPQHVFAEHLQQFAAETRASVAPIGDESGRNLLIFRKVSLHLMESIVTMELGGKRTDFIMPKSLRSQWERSDPPSVWEQLRRQMDRWFGGLTNFFRSASIEQHVAQLSHPWVLSMIWRDLLFASWRLPADFVRTKIPPELELDTFGGDAWVTLVPMHVTDLHWRGIDPIPGMEGFREINLRTYIKQNGQPGVYFFSIECPAAFADWIARSFFGVPYLEAQIANVNDGTSFHVASERTQKGQPPATLLASFRPTGQPAKPTPGSLESFLTDRYSLYFVKDHVIHRVDIVHEEWNLQPAEVTVVYNTISKAAGFQLSHTPDHVRFVQRTETHIFSPVVPVVEVRRPLMARAAGGIG